MLIQYVKCRMIMPKGKNWDEIRDMLKGIGCKIETTGVFIQMMNMPVPEEFRLNDKRRK